MAKTSAELNDDYVFDRETVRSQELFPRLLTVTTRVRECKARARNPEKCCLMVKFNQHRLPSKGCSPDSVTRRSLQAIDEPL